jgi:hypothetical protein
VPGGPSHQPVLLEERGQGRRGASRTTLTPRAAAEWGYRIVISLITTPTPGLDHDGTREYVAHLVRLMGFAVRASNPPAQVR